MVSFGSSRTQGVIFSLCASCCTSSGLVIQKHAHNSGEWRLPMMQRWRWWIGLVGVIMGGCADALVIISACQLHCNDCARRCFDSMALGLAPLSNIAPLSGITILLNSLLASFFLGHPTHKFILFAQFPSCSGETIRVVEIVATVVRWHPPGCRCHLLGSMAPPSHLGCVLIIPSRMCKPAMTMINLPGDLRGRDPDLHLWGSRGASSQVWPRDVEECTEGYIYRSILSGLGRSSGVSRSIEEPACTQAKPDLQAPHCLEYPHHL